MSNPAPERSALPPQGEREKSRRRGACPGLSVPMQTGDGLLVRFLAAGTVGLDAFKALCAAARQYGNAIVEITARGSIQVRGLTARSAPAFAAAVDALGIAAEGIAVHVDPLAGLSPDELIDAGAVAADLRRGLAHSALDRRLGPKVSVVIDGGGEPSLDRMAADLRLAAEQTTAGVALRVGIGGDAAGATLLGAVAPADATMAALRLLEIVAQGGRARRARDVLASEGVEPFRSAVRELLRPVASGARLKSRWHGDERKAVIGCHRLRDGALACGVGLAFGHAHAAALERLAEAATAAVAKGLRAGPDRTLFAIGLADHAAGWFVAEAERLGFIVRPDDARRRVVACAGAPVCAAALIPARALAPQIAHHAGDFLDDAATIHISGCVKGCAHPASAALTIVGTPDGCGLIAGGTPRDTPFAVVPPHDLSAAIVRELRGGRHG